MSILQFILDQSPEQRVGLSLLFFGLALVFASGLLAFISVTEK